ncbi:MAG TPA: MarR family winged helix-turn-helix transcriptional regulator [Alphaproteobacteria bacterium]
MNSRRKRGPADKSNGTAVDYALGDAPGHLLRRCQQRAVEIFMAETGGARVTPRQFAILLTLAHRPGLTQTELVVETGIDRSTVGDMIDRLVRRGLVRRRRSGRDQRANTLVILPAGLTLLRDTMPAVERAQERILMPLPGNLRQDFMTALRLMAADTKAAGPGGLRGAPSRPGSAPPWPPTRRRG